ncbi:MAG: PEP-CTERM sorting domain-containing protein [Phycisphaeraceae bacterium]
MRKQANLQSGVIQTRRIPDNFHPEPDTLLLMAAGALTLVVRTRQQGTSLAA